MAMRPDNRANEHGLSIIEALVIVTVTAMLALLLLPMASRAGGRNFALAERGLDAADAARGEREFRALLHAAEQQPGGTPSFSGTAESATFYPALAAPVACAEAGASVGVRVRIVRRGAGGRLLCQSARRELDLLTWAAGEARFSYSDDGIRWSNAWADARPAARGAAVQVRTAPLVKFELAGVDGLAWVERAGWTEKARPILGAEDRQ
jgi:hypothetical protein